ncbi:hypothetical protein [Actinomadura sp. 6K520]|uniref:hypothetical protein n=1 Tax=Actinomadura sp. 6K520 TaxID=2530364 RepID=UPI00104D3E2C|nr:hypothetical protein [Actinomadura sp. 6K520]TDE19227.1 hypothetical protein E1289_33635 [Actinomadura sp. 6K520]
MDDRPPGGRRRLVVAAVSGALVVAAALIVFGVRGESADEQPQTAATSVQQQVPVIPGAEPTYGEYVLPEADPQVATKEPPTPAPVPRTTPSRTKPAPTPTPSRSRTRRPCPPEWQDVWWMRRWCDDTRDRDGHRGR